jgi:hypothetical protein
VKSFGLAKDNFFKPEERNHPDFKDDMKMKYYLHLTMRKPLHRYINFM